MHRALRTVFLAPLFCLCATSLSSTTPMAVAGVGLKKIGDFNAPVFVAQPPGRHGLLFVVEQAGRIRVVRQGRVLAQPFLDIRSLVTRSGEHGLLSMAFDPGYASNGRFYVYFSTRSCDRFGGCTNEVAELNRSSGSAVHADRSSLRSVLRIRHPGAGNHNGGLIAFGPGGRHLFIGTGDGGNAGDPPNNAQNPNQLLGKLLRIDPLPGGGHTSPGGNPFVGRPGRDEIYAMGLRNPWRYAFDRPPGRAARLVIADVGQYSREEIDYVTLTSARGANFGWSRFEGTSVFNAARSAPGAIFPIKQYPHGGSNCAITGGYVMRDPALPSLKGRYLYGDFCAGQIRSFVPGLGGASGDRSLGVRRVPNLSSFGRDGSGHVYVTSLDGPVYRIVGR